MLRKIKVLIAKPGLDGHEMGARLVTRVLMDAGMEVIYTGPRQSAEMIVNAALQEGVDIIGLSFLAGAHKELTARIIDLMKTKGMGDVGLVVGGIIPPKDVDYLKSLGVGAVFGPGSDTGIITQRITDLATQKGKK